MLLNHGNVIAYVYNQIMKHYIKASPQISEEAYLHGYLNKLILYQYIPLSEHKMRNNIKYY